MGYLRTFNTPNASSLVDYVNTNTLTTSELYSFAMQIALGMEYLESVPCIHRDLAARNCLLTADRTVKISDFGMSKNEEYYRLARTDVEVPIRWMALESLETWKFTVETDVWSYGITLYEVFSLGAQPYAEVPSVALLTFLKEGNRNDCPEYANSDTFTTIIRACWDAEPKNRPTFSKCAEFFRGVLQNHSRGRKAYENLERAQTEWEKMKRYSILLRGSP